MNEIENLKIAYEMFVERNGKTKSFREYVVDLYGQADEIIPFDVVEYIDINRD